jgi:transcription elongation GreA/GreB family factor
MARQKVDATHPGTWVRVDGLVPGEKTTLYFVPEEDVNYSRHRLPLDSLLGETLAGTEVGDKVVLDSLDDLVELEVLEIGELE